MTTPRRRKSIGIMLAVLALVGASESDAKRCRDICGDDVATCRSACDDLRRPARRRCKSACKRQVLSACRAFPGDLCIAPTSTTTVEATTSTTSTTMPGGGGLTGFFPVVHVTSSGVDRTYSLYVPPSYDPGRAYPLVFSFHGDGDTGAGVRSELPLEAEAAGAAIFVYPDATEESGRHWTLDASLDANADMRLVLDVIAQLSVRYQLDPTRRFATGLSSGGFFVNFLNCTLGTTYLRAIAPHSGSGPYGVDADYDVDGHFICSATPAAVRLIHGTADDVVPLGDAEYTRQQWVWANGCAQATSPEPGPSPCVEHKDCDAGRPVSWCAIPGLGHEVWSQAPQAIWQFFARFLDAAPPPPPAAGTHMTVQGRDLYTADGERVILRGVNKMNVFDESDHDGSVSFPQIRAAGANTVRIVWMTATDFFVPTAADLDAVLGNAIANHLIPMIELHDATSNLWGVPALVDYWTRPDIVAVLKKHERFLLVNIANEAGAWDTTVADFVAVYRDAIARLRAAGIQAPLVIDAPDSGKNIDALMDASFDLQNADPERNLLFSVHIYWAKNEIGGGAQYIWERFSVALASGMPLVVGEFSSYGAWTAENVSICAPAGEVDYQTVLQAAQQYGIGWYAWEWGPGNAWGDPLCGVMDMTNNDRLSGLQPGWASDVVYGPYGLVATAVVPPSLAMQ